MRVLAFDRAGNLIAGTDGSGLIYRVTPQGEGFVLYSAPKKEITALAVDAAGNLYAAGAGDKRGAAPLPPPNPAAGSGAQPPTTIVIQQGAPQAGRRARRRSYSLPKRDEPWRIGGVSHRSRRRS